MSVAISQSVNTNSVTLKKLFFKEGEQLVNVIYYLYYI